MCVVCCVFFFKQKTAYEMRISDWSSDVCSSDLPVSRVVEGTDVAIFRVNGELFALADHCTHGDARLSEGWVEGNCVECPLHQARFNLLTGEAETGPAWEPVRAYKLRTDGSQVYIGL